MSTAIGKQVQAFGDAVIEAHREAMAFWTVQDVALTGAGVVRLILGVVGRRRAAGALGAVEREQFAQASRDMLAALSEGGAMISAATERGFEVKDVAEFNDAILTIRELLAWLTDGGAAPLQMPDYDDLTSTAGASAPPQSWFEEDLTGMRGHGR